MTPAKQLANKIRAEMQGRTMVEVFDDERTAKLEKWREGRNWPKKEDSIYFSIENYHKYIRERNMMRLKLRNENNED